MAESEEKLTIQQAVEKYGKYVGPTVGVSMLPMLKARRDTIVVLKKESRLKELDVALYTRGKDVVLHRVIRVLEDGYLIRGDNTYQDEYIKEDEVFGVLTEFFQADKHILCTDEKYLKYAKKRVKSYPRRRFFVRLKGKAVKVFRKIFPKRK